MFVLHFLVGLLSIVSVIGILYAIGTAVNHYLLEDDSDFPKCGIGIVTISIITLLLFVIGLVLVELTMLGELILGAFK